MRKEKGISSYVIVYRNSSKKLESLGQSGILLCRNNDCDVIKGVHSNPLARKKGPFFSITYRKSSNKIESLDQGFPTSGTRTTGGTRKISKWYARCFTKMQKKCLFSQKIPDREMQ